MKRLMRSLQLGLAVLAFSCTGVFAQSGKTEVLWLGHAAFRITSPGGKVIVIDPWLVKMPKTPAQYRDLDALGKVDAVLVTHGHFDHVTDAPELARKNKAPLVASSTLNRTLVATGALPSELAFGMNKSGTATPIGPDIKITMVRAEHSSEYIWRNPASDKDEILYGGEPVGFVIELENGFKIYHMGDTGLFGDMKFIGEYYKPDLIMIPIGGNFTMHPREAALATREFIKPKFAVPMHYGTFPILAGKAEDFVKEIGSAPTKVLVLQPGEKVTF